MKLVNLTLLTTGILLSACGPKDYDECILENIKNAKNDTAIAAVYMSCSSKFPTKDLPNEAKNSELELCRLYWDGLNVKKISSEPTESNLKFKKISIARYGIPLAEVFVSERFIEDDKSKAEIYSIVENYCKR